MSSDNEASQRLRRSKSEVVREAIFDYSERIEGRGERERRQLLASFDELVPKILQRPPAEVDAELRRVRDARRRGGRGSADTPR